MTTILNQLSSDRAVEPPVAFDAWAADHESGEHGHDHSASLDHHLVSSAVDEVRAGGHTRVKRPVLHKEGHSNTESESDHTDVSHDKGHGSDHDHKERPKHSD